MRPHATKKNKEIDKLEDNGKQGRQDRGKADTTSNTGTCGETTGDIGRQEPGKVGTPFAADGHVEETMKHTGGQQERHRPTHAYMWGYRIQHRRQKETPPEDKKQHLRRGRPSQWETRPLEGGRAIQQRHTCGRGSMEGIQAGKRRKTMEDTWENRRKQDVGKATAPPNTGTHGRI